MVLGHSRHKGTIVPDAPRAIRRSTVAHDLSEPQPRREEATPGGEVRRTDQAVRIPHLLAARSWLRSSPEGLKLFVLALTVNLAYWAIFRRHYVPMSDAEHYWGIGSNLAAGLGFSHPYPSGVLHETAFRLPLWPLVEAAFLTVFGFHLSVAMGVNAVIGGLVAWQAGALAAQVGGRRAGLVAGTLVALYPPLIANNVVPLSEPLGLLLLLVTVRLLGARRLRWAALVMGLLVLTKNGAAVAALAALIYVLVVAGWRQALRFIGIVAVVVTPWLVRNEVQLHTPALTTSIGFNVAAAYSEQAQASGRYFDDPTQDPRFLEWGPQRIDEGRWDATLLSLGWKGLEADPERVMSVAVNNVTSLMGFHDEDVPERLDGRVIGLVHASKPLFYLVSVLGLAGLWRWRRNPVVIPLAVVVGSLTFLSMVTIYAPRLRAPLDLACAIGVGLLFGARVPQSQLSVGASLGDTQLGDPPI